MSTMNSDKPLSGVKCVVESCVHHTTTNGCVANGIVVGGHDADVVSDTGCETFAKRECGDSCSI